MDEPEQRPGEGSEPHTEAPEDREGADEPPSESEVDEPPSESEVDAPPSESEVDAPPSEEPAIPVTPEPDPPSEANTAVEPGNPAPSEAAPPVQSPSAKPPSSASVPAPAPVAPSPPPAQPEAAQPEPAQPEPAPEAEPEPEPESYRKLGGIRLFRIGVAAKIGYTHGTSDKNGLYDRDKSIQDSIDNMMVTTSGAGDLGQTKFGGFQYGFIVDAEVVGINVWLDFHKFFNPGGMWSLLLGYDHEFGFGKRVRLDVGVGGGLNHVFLGKALASLYYDQDNPEAVNIGTLGLEGRAMVDLHIKLVGPLFTGPYAMLGYHYLWSANAAEVTAEKGLHYSGGWSLRLDFAAPKLLGGRAKK
ncbi:MAG: hypothetical protein R6X02_11360 [Enhygromyxa sp.]